MSVRGWVRVLGQPGLAGVVAAGLCVAGPAGSAQWRIQPTPNPPGALNILNGVSCASARSCTAVGTAQTLGLAERWDGHRWAIQSTPDPGGTQAIWLGGVSCPSAATCTAVGYLIGSAVGYVTLAERWDGRAWVIQHTPNPVKSGGADTSVLTGVSCVSASSCTAVGNFTGPGGHSHTLAERWNGRTWVIQHTADPGYDSELGGVSCVPADGCTAVGSYYTHAGIQVTLAERWNGHTWTTQPTPLRRGGPALNYVSCPSAATCIAIGSYYHGSGYITLAERWNGANWAIQPAPDPAAQNYPGGLSCTSPNACTAVGMALTMAVTGHYVSYAQHWDGHRWMLQPTPDPATATDSGLYDVSCTAANTCTAVGNFINPASARLTLAERYS